MVILAGSPLTYSIVHPPVVKQLLLAADDVLYSCKGNGQRLSCYKDIWTGAVGEEMTCPRKRFKLSPNLLIFSFSSGA